MKGQMAFFLALVLCGWLCGCSTGAPQPGTAHDSAQQHFESFLKTCGTNEVRTLWFLQDDPRIGMEMTIRLDDESVYTVRDVYDWAEQGAETHKLDDVQTGKIQLIISQPPAPDKHSQYASSVFVAFNDSGTNRVFQYDRHYTPAAIMELYGVAGGYFYGDEDN
jgi:hypothetical protein